MVYYVASLFLEEKGAALRYPSRFMEYALKRKRKEASEKLALLSQCGLLRHLPAEQIEPLLDRVREHKVDADKTIFRLGDPGTRSTSSPAARRGAERQDRPCDGGAGRRPGVRRDGAAERGTRTATVRTKIHSHLLVIGKANFDRLLAEIRSSMSRRASSATCGRCPTSGWPSSIPPYGQASPARASST